MDRRNYHINSCFDSVKQWEILSAVMASHLDWSVEKCKRRILEGYSLEAIKEQR